MRWLFTTAFKIMAVAGVPALAQQDAAQFNRASEYLDRLGEVVFSFQPGPNTDLKAISRMISIDHVERKPGNPYLRAYANRKEFREFLKLGLIYEVEPHSSDLAGGMVMASTPEELRAEWDKYPTYEAYVAMMRDFETRYPNLCKIVSIGKSIQGRDLLFAKLTANVNVSAPKPRNMFTSTMHGDETTMYPNFLRLIDFILTNYPTDATVKRLMDNVEIWICPLENPDGTYRGGNASIQGSIRGNANNQDLNRNYPLIDQPLPSNFNDRQPECRAMIKLVDSLQFTLSLNSHAGFEVMNYPFDYYNVIHPDDRWMQYVFRQFADAVHAINRNVLTGQDNGVTRGYVWYQIPGSRMDFFTFFKGMREVTFEASTDKKLLETRLPQYWGYYYGALLKLIEHNLFGINGKVTSSTTGQPIKARIRILNHDNAQSPMSTYMPHGDFYRPINAGTYNVEFTANGYQTHVQNGVVVVNDRATTLDIKLTPVGSAVNPHPGLYRDEIRVQAGSRGTRFLFNRGGNPAIFDYSGKRVRRFATDAISYPPSLEWDGRDDAGRGLPGGYYVFALEADGKRLTQRFFHSPK